MNLEKRLTRWVNAELLTPAQAEGIRAWESRQPSSSWILLGIAGVGVVALLCGIISIIAANWMAIPSGLKLGGYFISLATLGVYVVRRIDVPGVVRETLLVSFGLYILAGIGLIGQIYHLSGSAYEVLAWWCALTLPLVILTVSRLFVYLWCGGLAFAVWLWFIDPYDVGGTSLAVFSALPWLYIAAGYLLWNRLEHLSSALRTLGYGGLLLGWGIAAGIVWSTGAGVLLLWRETGVLGLLPLVGFFLAIAIVAVRRADIGDALIRSIIATLSLAGLLVLIPTYFHVTELLFSRVLGCALFIGAWSGAAVAAAQLGQRGLFDFAASIVALRFVVAYFEVFGSLAATGVGLIISGGVILGIAYLWHRFRGAVGEKIGGDR